MVTTQAAYGSGDADEFRHDGPIQRAGRLILDAGLRRGDSYLAPGSGAWSSTAAAALIDLIQQTDPGWRPPSARTFLFELGQRLHGAGAEVFVLAAELVALHLLPLHGLSATAKAQRVLDLLSASPQPVGLPDPVGLAFSEGIWDGRRAADQGLHRWLHEAAQFAQFWCALEPEQRERALDDPPDLAGYVYNSPAPQQLQHTVLNFWYPEVFVPLRSRRHKMQVANAYSHLPNTRTGDLDQDLVEIRHQLEHERHSTVQFYELPWRRDWQQPHRQGQDAPVLWRVTAPPDLERQIRWRNHHMIEVDVPHAQRLGYGAPRAALAARVDAALEGAPYEARAELRGCLSW